MKLPSLPQGFHGTLFFFSWDELTSAKRRSMFKVSRDSAVITTLRMKQVGCASGSHMELARPGKLIPYDSVFKRHQSSTDLVVVKDFFPFNDTRLYESARASGAEKDGVFPCPESGCQMIFEKFSDLEAHVDVGDHTPGKLKMESTFGKLIREWAQKFSTVDQVKESASSDFSTAASSKSTGFRCELPLGWALQDPRRGAPRFSAKVKEYLIAKFDIGEKTRDKADPTQVASDMQSAKDDNNSRLFRREEWLTKTQVN